MLRQGREGQAVTAGSPAKDCNRAGSPPRQTSMVQSRGLSGCFALEPGSERHDDRHQEQRRARSDGRPTFHSNKINRIAR